MTPFATLAQPPQALEKAALAKGVSKGIGWLGNMIGRSGQAAKSVARRGAFQGVGGGKAIAGQADRLAMRDLTASAAKGVGNRRLAIADRLGGASQAITNSPGMQSAINYGGGGLLGAGALYGSNRMGHASGREAGIGEGMDVGMQAGVQAALANQDQNQPGYLGGLWNAIKGEPMAGMNAGNVYSDLAGQRQQLISRLMGKA